MNPVIGIRFKPADLEIIKKLAKEDNRPLAAFIRNIVLKQIKK